MKNTSINSTLAMTSAFLITIVLHEVSHYVTAFFLGCEPTLFHNRVTTPMVSSELNQFLIMAAGPLFSLLQGVVAY